MRMFVAVALLLSLGLAGMFWFTGDSLAFKPKPGDSRHFILEQTAELQTPSGFRREPTRVRMESLLRSDVLAVDKDVVELQSRSLHTQLWEQDRLGLDTEQIPEYSDRLQSMAALLKAGIVERVASDGQVLETNYVNEAALAELTEDSRLPEPVRDMLSRDLSVMHAYQPTFPSGKPRVGLSWQVPARDMGGQSLPAVQYEISHVNDDTVSLKFRSVTTEGATDTAAVEVEGFMELERLTGWPRRAAARISGVFEYADEHLELKSTMTLTQAGIEPRFNAGQAWYRALGALDSRVVDSSDPEFETYYLPPFGLATPEESFEQLERSLLWFGNEEVDGRLGLDFQIEHYHFAAVEFEPASAVRLLDAEGEPVIDSVPRDPRYTLYSIDSADHRRVPFLASELTREQLDAISSVEVDATVTIPGELHSFVLTPETPSRHIESLGLTLSVESWDPDGLLVRAHEPGGSLPTSFPLIGAYPVNAGGDFLPMFSLRLTHTAIEPLRNAFLETSDEGDHWARAEQFAHSATDTLITSPMEERYGDWIYELGAEGVQPIEGVRVYVYDREVGQRTFIAPSALPTLDGGPVVGERTLEQYREPVLEFSPFELDEVVLQGARQNRLSAVVPGEGAGRCDISVAGEPMYQGSPVSFSAEQSYGTSQLLFASGAYNDQPGRELVTAHGLKYFYDLEIDVNVDCITKVVLHRGPVPDNGQLFRVDPSTLRLSKSQHQTLKQIQHRFNLRELPLIAYNRDGKVLEPLSPAYSGNPSEGWDGDGMDLRFWGEIAEVRYPVRMEREAKQVSVQFPPLP